jgi:hypothetical protein
LGDVGKYSGYLGGLGRTADAPGCRDRALGKGGAELFFEFFEPRQNGAAEMSEAFSEAAKAARACV